MHIELLGVLLVERKRISCSAEISCDESGEGEIHGGGSHQQMQACPEVWNKGWVEGIGVAGRSVGG